MCLLMLNLQEALPKEISSSEKSCLKTETKRENSTSSTQMFIAKDAVPESATVCPPCLDTSTPVTTDPVEQLSISTKMKGKETEETLKEEAMEKPEGVTQNDALNQEQIEASNVKLGLVSKDKDNVGMGTESDLREMSKSKPIEKETVRQSTVSEDQQGAVSFLAAVPVLETNTTPQEDTALVH